jgi:hypothetical protein
MAGAGIGRGPVLAPVVASVLCHPGRVDRARMCRLQPRPAQGRGGEQQRERQKARTAEQANHRWLK